MSTVIDIKKAIEGLAPDDLRALCEWLAQREADEWDRKFAADVAAGKLDELAEEVREDLREGRCSEL